VKFGGGGITAWRCFSRNGFGLLIILRGKINAEGYKDILTRCILFTVEDQFGDDNYLYHHDSFPCHISRYVREWFVDNNVPDVDWPAQSPDLNPIEHLWDELERLTLLTALAAALQEEWAAIPPETFRHLVVSIPGRVRAVIKAKVGPPVNVFNWKICHRESQIIVSSECPDTFEKLLLKYLSFFNVFKRLNNLKRQRRFCLNVWFVTLLIIKNVIVISLF
jgi:hypothetical protein